METFKSELGTEITITEVEDGWRFSYVHGDTQKFGKTLFATHEDARQTLIANSQKVERNAKRFG